MEFTVPQFIERKPKIVGPFTFGQFVFIGTAGAVCIFLYFIIPFWVFIIAALILMGAAFALALLKVKMVSLPVFIKNFFVYIASPKIYLWKKKSALVLFKKAEKEKKEEIEKKSPLKIAEKSRLRELFTHLETKK